MMASSLAIFLTLEIDSFDPNTDLFPEPPPQPARGEPLLSDNDSKSLGSFFDFVSADPFNSTSFGEGLNFSDSWFTDIPPQFVGSHTSLGQPSLSPSHLGLTPAHDFGDLLGAGAALMPPPPPPPQTIPQPSPTSMEHHTSPHQHATADVLAAAALLRNGVAGRNPDGHRDPPRGLVPVGHLRHQGLEDFRQDGHKSIQQGPQPNEHDSHFTEMFFGGARDRPSMPRQAHAGDVQWGSDSAFNPGQGYVPRSACETYEAMAKKQHELIECLEVNQSGANTCPSSPVTGETSPTKTHSRKSSELCGKRDDLDGPPRKRRKSRVQVDVDDDEEEDSPAPKSRRRRKPKSVDSPPANGTASEKGSAAAIRRKSTSGGKASRENLSEEQKRENHIRSEQKRRTLIKQGFDDLVSLVPDLQDGGFSKSTMLSTAAEWLEGLLDYNKQLALHLASLNTR